MNVLLNKHSSVLVLKMKWLYEVCAIWCKAYILIRIVCSFECSAAVLNVFKDRKSLVNRVSVLLDTLFGWVIL